ncbi:MAG: metallophosphoesterase family protein [Vulcanimicrobiaceae bacterium]
MRVALVSDIHGNIRALDACLADLRVQGGADLLVGAGDYCMDGPKPRKVLERLTELGAHCVRGNTDRAIAWTGLDDPAEAAQLAWQRERLGKRWVRWLGALPFSLRVGSGRDGLLVVHANPVRDDEYVRPDADDAFLERITWGVSERAIAFGHLHMPYIRMWRDKLFVNVASAGLPKDGDPRAAYAIATQRSNGWEVVHRRVGFDVERVVREIRSSGMPDAKGRVRVLRRHRYK